MLDACVTSEIQHRLPVLLERLPGQDLREQVSRVRGARDVADHDTASAAKLTHLEELAVDVAGVLRLV